eukprot:947529-Rhodomonas_salina.1
MTGIVLWVHSLCDGGHAVGGLRMSTSASMLQVFVPRVDAAPRNQTHQPTNSVPFAPEMRSLVCGFAAHVTERWGMQAQALRAASLARAAAAAAPPPPPADADTEAAKTQPEQTGGTVFEGCGFAARFKYRVSARGEAADRCGARQSAGQNPLHSGPT